MVEQETRLLLLGAGGHARAVTAALDGVVDEHVGPGEQLTDDAALALDPSTVRLVNGLGFQGEPTSVREFVYRRFCDAGFQFVGACHRQAVIDDNATVASDAQVLIGATLVVGSSIGANAIINTRASVDHDSTVGPHSHVGPGAIVCGDVVVGSGVFIGAGAVVLPGVLIGDRAVVGAGAVVTENVAAGDRVVGVPARLLGGER